MWHQWSNGQTHNPASILTWNMFWNGGRDVRKDGPTIVQTPRAKIVITTLGRPRGSSFTGTVSLQKYFVLTRYEFALPENDLRFWHGRVERFFLLWNWTSCYANPWFLFDPFVILDLGRWFEGGSFLILNTSNIININRKLKVYF